MAVLSNNCRTLKFQYAVKSDLNGDDDDELKVVRMHADNHSGEGEL